MKIDLSELGIPADFGASVEEIRKLDSGLVEYRYRPGRSLSVEETSADGTKVSRSLPGIPFTAPVERVAHSARAVSDTEASEDAAPSVEGFASSTSVDSYGTEMSKACLDNMAEQFVSGVSITPRHMSFFDVMEWDDVLGVSYFASVESGPVADAVVSDEPQYTLRIKFRLLPGDVSDEASKLAARIKANQTIGLSIGGWFTDIRIIANDDGEVQRVIIDGVLLDHCAVTRRPSNPDSIGLRLLRSVAARAAAKRTVNEPTEVVVENDTNETTEPIVPEPIVPVVETAPELVVTDPVVAPVVEAVPEPVVIEVSPESETPAEVSAPAEPIAYNDNESPTEYEMDPKLIESLAASVALLAERVAAPAPAVAPVVEPSAAEVELRAKVAALEAEKARLEASVSRADSGPAVRGFASRGFFAASGVPGTQLDALIARARECGAPSVAAATESFRDVMEADRYDAKISRSKLETALFTVCNAAVSDGIIKDPSLSATAWQ